MVWMVVTGCAEIFHFPVVSEVIHLVLNSDLEEDLFYIRTDP